MNVNCRWLTELDAHTARRVVELYNAVIREEDLLGYPTPLEGEEARNVAAELSDAVRERRYEFMAICRGEKLIGMGLLKPNSLPNCRHLGELSKGIVHPQHRSRIAFKLGMLAIANRCRELGIERIVLDVRENSRAHALWVSLGFQPYGRLQDYARVGGRTAAGVYMEISTERLLATLQHGRRQLTGLAACKSPAW